MRAFKIFFIILLLFICLEGLAQAQSASLSNVASNVTWLGQSGSVNVTYTLTTPSTDEVFLQVNSSGGKIVRTINVGNQSSGTYSIVWDGCDISGARVASGAYTIKVYVAGGNGLPDHVSWQYAASGIAPFVAVDHNNNLVIADYDNFYMLYPNGTQKLLLSQDDYWDTIYTVDGIAFDNYGNMYIADSGNNQIDKLSPDGTISTLISLEDAPGGVAVDSKGNIYYTLGSNVKEYCTDGSTKVLASDIWCHGIAIDSKDNLFVVVQTDFNSDGNYILKITIGTDGTVTRKLVATGLNNPYVIAVDPNDNVYWAGYGYALNRINADGSSTRIGETVRDSQISIEIGTHNNFYVTNIDTNEVDEYEPVQAESDPLSVKVDSLSPVSSCTLYGDNTGNWYSGDVFVNISVIDPVSNGVSSGVKTTMYSLDNVTWKMYTGNFTIPATPQFLSYTLKYYSVDNMSNVELVKSVNLSVVGASIALTVNGTVSKQLNLTMADLKAYPNVSVDVTYGGTEHKGEGVSIMSLLNDSHPWIGASTVTFISSDASGYNVTVPIAEIAADPSAVIMYQDDGTLRDVIPSEGSAKNWVRNLSVMKVSQEVNAANFTVKAKSGNIPFTVQFNDTSFGNATSWSWSFGDGGTSNARNATHTYDSVGTYTVSLTITSLTGSTTMTKANFITVNPQPPGAQFTLNSTGGLAPITVLFWDTSSGNPTSWSWDFGDGNTSTLPDPVYTFSAPGHYYITLNVSNAGGSNTVTHDIFVVNGSNVALTVQGGVKKPLYLTLADLHNKYPQLSLSFDYWSSSEGGQKHMNVSGASLNAILNDAGLLNSSTDVTFIAPDYRATVQMYKIQGDSNSIIAIGSPPDGSLRNIIPSEYYAQDWVYDLATINVNQRSPVANFTADTMSGKTPLIVQFNDTSSNDPSSWVWSFGDGNTSISQNPSHTYYTPGNYAVSLTVTNSGGSNVGTKNSYVSVSPSKPIALTITGAVGTPLYLSMDDLLAYPQITETVSYIKPYPGGSTYYITVTGPSLNAILNDSHVASSAGTVTLNGNSPDGSVGAEFPLSDITSDPGAIMAIYPDGSLRDVIPIQNAQCAWMYDITSITVNQPTPAADFNASPTSGEAPLMVQFTDKSSNGPTSWLWDFGDGETSGLQNPMHEYKAPSSYTVNLTTHNAGGSNTVSKSGYISVSSAPGGGSDSFTFDLRAGWNLVSIPLVNNSLWADQLQGTGVVVVAMYNKTSGGYDPYEVGVGPLSDDKQITIDNAYFMYSTRDTSITVRGNDPSGRTISLSPGWNMVGWSSLNLSNAHDVAGMIPDTQVFARYNRTSNGYDPYMEGTAPIEDSFTIKPGEGYFIWTTNATTLTYGQTAPTATATATATVTPVPGSVVLTVSGKVANPMNLTMAQLQAYPLISKNVSYVKMGSTDTQYMNVTGASLSAILDNAGVWDNATIVVFTGSDGVWNNISISEILGDPNAMIAFNAPPHNSLRNVLPSEGSPGGWIFDLVSMKVD